MYGDIDKFYGDIVIRKKGGMENTFSLTGYLAADFILT